MKCRTLHNERLFPERARGTFLITTLCKEATGTWHGATSHLETAAAWPHVHMQTQTCLLLQPPPPHSRHTTCLPPWQDERGMQKNAGMHNFKLLLRVYSLDKYLVSLSGEQDMSLDIVLKLGMEESNDL